MVKWNQSTDSTESEAPNGSSGLFNRLFKFHNFIIQIHNSLTECIGFYCNNNLNKCNNMKINTHSTLSYLTGKLFVISLVFKTPGSSFTNLLKQGSSSHSNLTSENICRNEHFGIGIDTGLTDSGKYIKPKLNVIYNVKTKVYIRVVVFEDLLRMRSLVKQGPVS